MRAWLVVATFAIAACAPSIDGPVERQRAIDRDDGDRLAAQLAQLPGAVRASVVLHRATRDPLAPATPPSPAGLAAVIVVDDRADRAAVARAAARLARATAPEIAEPSIAVELGAVRPELARVGPFAVAAGDRSALVATLAGAALVIAALASWLAWRERWRVRRGR